MHSLCMRASTCLGYVIDIQDGEIERAPLLYRKLGRRFAPLVDLKELK